MLTLLIGDLFIPERAVQIPIKFQKLLSPNTPAVPSNAKISQVLCLGNITQSASTLKFLYDLSPFFCAVRGEFDDLSIVSQQLTLLGAKLDSNLPPFRVVSTDSFRIGVISGHQIFPRDDPLLLLAFAREIEVDILVWGGTHRVEAYTLDGKFFINPGSATGAFSMHWPDLEDDDEDGDDEEDAELGHSQNIGMGMDGVSKIDLEIARRTESANVKGKEMEKELEEDSGKMIEEEEEHEGQDKKVEDPEFDSSALSSRLPSFCLLDTNASRCTLYIYTYVNDEVKVDKVMYSKN